MKNKTIIVVAAFLAVFLITIGIGVVSDIVSANAAEPTATPDVAAFIAREEAYQKVINEANQKIELANTQISELVNVTPEFTATVEQPYLFSAEQAASIAVNLAGMQPDNTPELVDFSGSPAFEVVFSNGKVYVDANTGAVLYNGLQEQKGAFISSDKAIYYAEEYMGGSSAINVSFGTYNGVNVYIVQFANGQSVYVNLYGHVVAVQMAPVTSSGESEDEEEHELKKMIKFISQYITGNPMKNTPIRKKKSFVPDAFKVLVAIISLGGTFGLWNILANRDLKAVKAESDPTTGLPDVKTLPPIPTLVPLIIVEKRPTPVTSSEVQPPPVLRSVIAPTQAPYVQVSSEGVAPAIIEAPVTSTKSSK